MPEWGPISHFLSLVSCDSLVLQGLRCEWGAGVFNLVLSLLLSHTGYWKFNMTPHGKELSEDLKKIIVALHKDGVGYKKIAKTLKLSCSMGPRPYSGLTGQVPLWAGLAMVYQINWVHMLSVISQGCVWEIDVWVLPALLQRLKGWGSACQCSEHTPHTATNWSAWLLSQKEASSKNDAQESPKTVCWRQAD